MPIHVGIACQSCERVYFIARTDQIEFLAETFEYQLFCPPPCGVTRLFDKKRMAPYSVSTYCYNRGYANPGEYQLLRRPNWRLSSSLTDTAIRTSCA